MNLNNFTIKAQETLQQAQQAAFNNGNPTIESSHILQALVDDKDGPIEFLLKKSNANPNLIHSRLEECIGKLPKQNGGDAGQMIGRDANNVILRAGSALKEFGDEFVSVEHLLLAILRGNDDASKILKDAGLTEKALITAIKELRKGGTVNSQTADTTYNALQKYAKNLNDMAQNGKPRPGYRPR